MAFSAPTQSVTNFDLDTEDAVQSAIWQFRHAWERHLPEEPYPEDEVLEVLTEAREQLATLGFPPPGGGNHEAQQP